MKHDYIYLIISLILISIGTLSCRATKDIERTETIQSGTSRIERSADTLRTVEVRNERSNRSVSELERQYSRVTEFDSTGAVRRVSETWWDRRHSNLDNEERDARTVSIAGSENNVITRDTSSVVIKETVHSKTDSRPIQGIEWIWVILSVAVIVAAIIIYKQLT